MAGEKTNVSAPFSWRENEMTLLTSLSRPFSSKKDWPKRLRRKWWILQIGSLLLYTFLFFIPQGCLWITEIPPFQELQVSQGIVSIEKRRKGSVIFLIEASGKYLYSCEAIYDGGHACFPQSKIENLDGKQATAWWFEWTPYPLAWIHHRQLVHLVVEDQEIFTYEKFLRGFSRVKKSVPYRVIFLLLLPLFSIWWLDFWINRCVVSERETPPRNFPSAKKFYRR